jgi:hypothetical protein
MYKNPVLKFKPVDFLEKAALDSISVCVLNASEFKLYASEVLSDGFLVTVGPISQLPDGKTRYYDRSSCHKVTISRKQLATLLNNFEHKTGRCSVCQGNGVVFKSWNTHEGSTYIDCDRCAGSGVSHA